MDILKQYRQPTIAQKVAKQATKFKNYVTSVEFLKDSAHVAKEIFVGTIDKMRENAQQDRKERPMPYFFKDLERLEYTVRNSIQEQLRQIKDSYHQLVPGDREGTVAVLQDAKAFTDNVLVNHVMKIDAMEQRFFDLQGQMSAEERDRARGLLESLKHTNQNQLNEMGSFRSYLSPLCS